MAKKLQLRRGTTSQHGSFTGAVGEVTVDTDKKVIVVHDESTAGGFPMARGPASAGTVNASELAQVDANKDITGFRNITLTGELDAATGDFSGNVDIDGTCEADAYTVNGTALDTHIAGVTVTNATNAVTATNANHVSVADNESTNENNLITFIEDASATGNVGLESDGDFHYNPSTGLLSCTGLTLTGNLTVNGTTTTVASTNTTISDNLLELNSGASSNANDSGIIIERGSTGDNAIIAWDESADKFTVGTTAGTASSTGDISITTGTLVANVEGNVTGNVTGNTSGSAGSCTGNAATATTSTNVTLADESSDTSCNVLFATAATGNLPPKTGTNLTFNSSTGDLTATIVTDGKGELRTIPQLSKSSKHTIVLADAGKHSINSSGGWEFDTSTAFTAGLAITLINNSGSDQTIEADGVTLYNTADGNTGDRTLAQRGMATVICTASNTYYISGAGLS